jgi:hypothetical protein
VRTCPSSACGGLNAQQLISFQSKAIQLKTVEVFVAFGASSKAHAGQAISLPALLLALVYSAIPLNFAKINPFDKVKDFDIPDRGHVPWPAWAIAYVREQAWPDLVRMEKLGIMTC